jgi:CubicO group peptidase (beta-lactamase class C family)
MRRALRPLLLALAVVALAFAADFGAAAVVYGPEYVWRLMVWRTPSPRDDARYPARPVAASAHPVHFPVDPSGAALVRAAFARAAPAGARPGEPFEDFLGRTRTTSLLVLRDGRLLYEGYFNGHRRDTVQASLSLAKSVVALLIGAAVADGSLPAIDTPAEALLPEVAGLRGSGITLRNLLDMTPGFAMASARRFGPFGAPWNDYTLTNFAPDLRAIAASVRPEFPPGTHFRYDGRDPMLLGMMLERAPPARHVADWLEQRLWQPMGGEFPASWSLGSAAGGFEKMQSGINARPIDFLKIGQLVLRRGVAESGERVVPASWIEQATAPSPRVGGWIYDDDMFYGLFWWGFRRAAGPPDVFAEGMFGQAMLVSPANGMVVLRTGDGEGGVASWPRLLRALADAVGPAGGERYLVLVPEHNARAEASAPLRRGAAGGRGGRVFLSCGRVAGAATRAVAGAAALAPWARPRETPAAGGAAPAAPGSAAAGPRASGTASGAGGASPWGPPSAAPPSPARPTGLAVASRRPPFPAPA